MKLHRARRARLEIPTASMADIAFLLIIFYMVGTKFQVDKQTVQLPATVLRSEILAESPFISIMPPTPDRTLGVNGSVVRYSSGKDVSQPVLDLDDLEQRVSVAVREGGGRTRYFVIKADVDVPYETFDLVLAALRDASATNVVFLSRRKP